LEALLLLLVSLALLPFYILTWILEALACKTPVNWNGLIIDSPLPKQHKPEVVAARTIEIYKEILN